MPLVPSWSTIIAPNCTISASAGALLARHKSHGQNQRVTRGAVCGYWIPKWSWWLVLSWKPKKIFPSENSLTVDVSGKPPRVCARFFGRL
ncbi:uncharacterized protein P174DRAFT_200133 [Aspergillus novofumigatus IBT 16806]|uniref:Uncharacterized protein n=1 Tax=Aspergillus novofumigatus (strain IBT 16806) TaxID=1392255 RepID=A0A2I1C496_ASPN1|nr:uncharacterized protein P174DRAFT_200133 [Aspergillus novofumigatus IBT 16806]PKX92452.1 hypothetical protein P174DRAFT_200133 [Aspergillus novofumigatus IBT 16806]